MSSFWVVQGPEGGAGEEALRTDIYWVHMLSPGDRMISDSKTAPTFGGSS